MKQHECVVSVMEKNGGYATLGFLYNEVLKVEDCSWKTKTPFASIRRIVQDERFFFKIKPGLWALKSHKDKIPKDLLGQSLESKAEEEATVINHTYYQGLLVEIGNLKGFSTFVPYQDKNRFFINKKLGEATNLSKVFDFGYESLVNKAQTVDVSWFNSRKMPSSLFEVEHSTNIINSLAKFVELQDFYVDFFIVSSSAMKKLYNEKIAYSSFESIKSRTKFLSYDQLSEWHSKSYEFFAIQNQIMLGK